METYDWMDVYYEIWNWGKNQQTNVDTVAETDFQHKRLSGKYLLNENSNIYEIIFIIQNMYHTRAHSTKKNTNHIKSAFGSGRQIQEMRIKEINKENMA